MIQVTDKKRLDLKAFGCVVMLSSNRVLLQKGVFRPKLLWCENEQSNGEFKMGKYSPCVEVIGLTSYWKYVSHNTAENADKNWTVAVNGPKQMHNNWSYSTTN